MTNVCINSLRVCHSFLFILQSICFWLCHKLTTLTSCQNLKRAFQASSLFKNKHAYWTAFQIRGGIVHKTLNVCVESEHCLSFWDGEKYFLMHVIQIHSCCYIVIACSTEPKEWSNVSEPVIRSWCENELMEMNLTGFILPLPDELFQKVAEDYNNTAFQYMTGECFIHVHSVCLFACLFVWMLFLGLREF